MQILKGKFCTYCNALHPNTTQYWYPRSWGKECRIKRAKMDLAYREKYLERKLELQKQRLQRNHDKYKAHYTAVSRSLNGRYSQLRTSANKRKLAVDLTKEQYSTLLQNPCHYCGGHLPVSGAGIDRIDPQSGYSLENCVPCCKRCNLAKHVMSLEEFRQWAVALYNKFILQAGG